MRLPPTFTCSAAGRDRTPTRASLPPVPCERQGATRAGPHQCHLFQLRAAAPRPRRAPGCRTRERLPWSHSSAVTAERGQRPARPRPRPPLRAGGPGAEQGSPPAPAGGTRRPRAARGAGRPRVPPYLVELVLRGDAQFGVYSALQRLDDPVGIHLGLRLPAGSAFSGQQDAEQPPLAPPPPRASSAGPRPPPPPRPLSTAIHRFATAGYRETGAALRPRHRLLASGRGRSEVAAILLYG